MFIVAAFTMTVSRKRWVWLSLLLAAVTTVAASTLFPVSPSPSEEAGLQSDEDFFEQVLYQLETLPGVAHRHRDVVDDDP